VSASIDHRIAVPGGHLFAREWPGSGDDPPIVLLHESLGCVELWRDFPASLAAATGRRVIAYDRLGFGRSDPHPGLLLPDFIASEAEGGLSAVVDALRLDAFVLCGHSVGGGMALSAAPYFSSRCRAVVSISAQSFLEDVTRAGVRVARETLRPGSDRIERLRKYHGSKAEWVVAAWIETWLHPDLANWSLAPVLPHIRCPVLAMHGDTDEFGSLRHPEMIREMTGGPVEVAILTHCGHMPMREQPARVIGLIAAFLENGL